jgi:hypothetical protein
MAAKVIKALDIFVTYMSALEKAHLVNYKRTLRFSNSDKA